MNSDILSGVIESVNIFPVSLFIAVTFAYDHDCGLITTISNAQQLTLAGYQVGFGWDADSLQMPAAPFVAPTDVLQDLFMFNAPPYGSGWASAPSAGDSIGREYAFLLGVALTAGSQFSGTSGEIPSFYTLGVNGKWNIDKLDGMSIGLSIDNITDVVHRETYLGPAMGRFTTLSVGYDL